MGTFQIQHYLKLSELDPYSLDATALTKRSHENENSSYTMEDILNATEEQVEP